MKLTTPVARTRFFIYPYKLRVQLGVEFFYSEYLD